MLFCSQRASAATYTWTGEGGSVLFNAAGNWSGGVPLSSSTTDLVMTGANNTGTLANPLNQNVAPTLTLNSLTFDTAAGSFYMGGGALSFAGTSKTITQNSANAQTILSNISAPSSATTITLGGNGSGIVTLSGVISTGSGTKDYAITKNGSSTFSLTGANAYKGATTISAGALNIQHASALGSTTGATTVASGAALQLQGAIAIGAEGLTLNGSGIGNTGALRSISGTNSFGGAITLASATTIGSDAGSLNLSGSMSGNFGFTKVGAGTLVLSGANNTFTGTITVQNGTLSFATPVLGALGNAIVLGGVDTTGVLQYTGTGGTTSRSYTLVGGGSGVIAVTNSAASFTMNTAIAGSGSLGKTGEGTLVLAGANTFSGGTTLTAGTLRLGASERLADTGSLTISGGTFDLQSFNETVGSLTITGGTITGTGTLTTSAPFSLQSGIVSVALGGSSVVTKTTSGTTTLNTANSYTGATNITGGSLQVNVNNALGTAASGTTVASGAALTLNNVNYSTAETLTLNGSGVSNGGALVNTGISSYAGSITAATHATINAGGGTLNLTGGLVKNGTTLTLTGGGTINVSGTGISGSSPNSDLVVDNTTVILNAASTYNGPTTVQNTGTLRLGASNVLPGSPQTAMTVNTSSVLDLASHSDGVASLAGDSTATVRNSTAGTTSTLTVNPATGVSTTFAGVIAGTAGGQGDMALVKIGGGSLTLSGGNTYSGATTISGGTLIVANTAGPALANTASVTVNSGGTLLLGASNQVNDAAPVVLAGGTIAKGDFVEGKFSDGIATPGFGALTLTATGSRLDFGTGTVGTLSFASFTPGTFALTIDNWTGTANTAGTSGTDRLIFSTDQTSNLSSFNFSGYGSGATQFVLSDGLYEVAPVTPVPEPGTYAAAALAFASLLFSQRGRQLCSTLILRRNKPGCRETAHEGPSL